MKFRLALLGTALGAAATAGQLNSEPEQAARLKDADAANNTMLNTGSMLINLRDHHSDQQKLMDRLRERVRNVAGIDLSLQPTQDLTIDSETGPTQYRVSLEGAGWTAKLALREYDVNH